ncbi:sensor histidine kinase [Actinoplanes sp. NPDC048796]|uniref:sensor histidine kinase n=1 Tax=unclassified Actinoplanes TaxID=2626549 RepID=UPI0033C999FF
MAVGGKSDRLITVVPYIALVCSIGLIALGDLAGVPHQPWPIIGGALAVTAAWLFWWVTMHPEWEQHRGKMAVFFGGLIVLIFFLVWCSPLFGFFAWTGYLFTAYALRSRWMVTGGVFVAIPAGLSQAGGFYVLDQKSAWPVIAVLLIINIGVSGTMIRLTARADERAAQQIQEIDELAEANAKLAAALKENESLHAQLMVQAREAGKLDERQRMAGEIHDVLAQGLTGIVTQLEAAGSPGGDRDRHLEAAKKLARDSLTEARRSVHALRPRTLDAAALPEAIGEVMTSWSRLSGVGADLVTTGTARPLLPEIEATLLRTAQEALANVARHASAERVTLTLSYMEDVVTLDVHDDGAGFDPAAPRAGGEKGGYGLVAMKERLRRIAGTLEVESEPGGGTAVSACVPALFAGAGA